MDKKHEEKPIYHETTAKEVSTTEIIKLGNQAVKKGLISGHGYHQGKYEILCNGQVFLLSPEKAYSYLKTLTEQHQK
ncbi:MAG: hypothetical protein WBG73_17445 [Coleofasciculaceae cyanobacterium]